MSRTESKSDLVPGLIEDVDIFKIKPTKLSLRIHLDNIEQLAQSIKEKGLLQPIVIRADDSGYFEIVAGNRRFNACKSLGWRNIPCHIIELDDKGAFEISLIENMQRKTLNPVEEAEAFKKYVSDYGYGGISDLAKKIGKSQEYVSKRIKLLDLPEEVRSEVIRRRITSSVAEELAYVKDKKEQSRLAQLVAKRHVTLKQFRQVTKGTNNLVTNELTEPQAKDNDKNLVVVFDKAIIVLRYSMSKLVAIMDKVEDNWIVYETLMQHKSMLHSQIDLLIKQKKKLATYKTV